MDEIARLLRAATVRKTPTDKPPADQRAKAATLRQARAARREARAAK